jgi:hypothetical protein
MVYRFSLEGWGNIGINHIVKSPGREKEFTVCSSQGVRFFSFFEEEVQGLKSFSHSEEKEESYYEGK